MNRFDFLKDLDKYLYRVCFTVENTQNDKLEDFLLNCREAVEYISILLECDGTSLEEKLNTGNSIINVSDELKWKILDFESLTAMPLNDLEDSDEMIDRDIVIGDLEEICKWLSNIDVKWGAYKDSTKSYNGRILKEMLEEERKIQEVATRKRLEEEHRQREELRRKMEEQALQEEEKLQRQREEERLAQKEKLRLQREKDAERRQREVADRRNQEEAQLLQEEYIRRQQFETAQQLRMNRLRCEREEQIQRARAAAQRTSEEIQCLQEASEFVKEEKQQNLVGYSPVDVKKKEGSSSKKIIGITILLVIIALVGYAVFNHSFSKSKIDSKSDGMVKSKIDTKLNNIPISKPVDQKKSISASKVENQKKGIFSNNKHKVSESITGDVLKEYEFYWNDTYYTINERYPDLNLKDKEITRIHNIGPIFGVDVSHITLGIDTKKNKSLRSISIWFTKEPFKRLPYNLKKGITADERMKLRQQNIEKINRLMNQRKRMYANIIANISDIYGDYYKKEESYNSKRYKWINKDTVITFSYKISKAEDSIDMPYAPVMSFYNSDTVL